MKRIILMMTLVLSIAIAQAQDQKKEKPQLQEVSYKCSLHCEACKETIMKNIAYEKGVKDVSVDMDTKVVTVKYRADKNSKEQIKAAIEVLGYEANEQKAPTEEQQ